jgi:hypothetical protein
MRLVQESLVCMLLSSVTLIRAFSSFSSSSMRVGGSSIRRITLPSSSLRSTMSDKDILPTTTDTVNGSSQQQQSSRRQFPLEMTDDEKYLFDLNGYLVVRGVLTPEEVQQANDAIDQHAEDFVERSGGALRNAVQGTKLYGTGPGRQDLGQVLEWGHDDSQIFQSVLAHPRLVPLFHGILGKGYRMDHLPLVLAQEKGAEGFQLHGGTIDCGTGEYNPFLAYNCHHGKIQTALLGVNVMLVDHNAGDGGFCIVPGSHKSNFKMPAQMMNGEAYDEFIRQPVTKAGDVVLFSEGTVHGAQAWTADHARRACLYRFSPATNVYGRSYFGHEQDESDGADGVRVGWPAKMYEGLNEAQRAVLEPPYANRLDRPNINEDGSVVITTRNERKKQHDQDVFGTKYF